MHKQPKNHLNEQPKPISIYPYVYLAALQTICQAYWNRIVSLEGDKFDLEQGCEFKKLKVKRIKIQTSHKYLHKHTHTHPHTCIHTNML